MTDANTLSPCPHLESCPWCGCALYAVWRRANPRASCKTEGCFGRKMAVVNLDDPSDVAAWNRRAPAPTAAAEVAVPIKAGEYPPLVCDYCGALTPDPWHSSGMLHGKMSKHIHSCDACAARGAAQAAPAPSASIEQEAMQMLWNDQQQEEKEHYRNVARGAERIK